MGDGTRARRFGWFEDVSREHGFELLRVEGDLPRELAGTLYRTGPGLFGSFGRSYAHLVEGDGAIVTDFVRHADLRAMGTMSDAAVRDGAIVDMDGGALCRATIDWRAGRMDTERVFGEPCEFPTIDVRGAGAPHRYAWVATTEKRPRSIVRFDFERRDAAAWTPPPGQHVSEPVIAPRAAGDGECDGWALVLVYDERIATSHVAVLDAAHPEDGPVARVHFDHHVPLTLHGCWVGG